VAPVPAGESFTAAETERLRRAVHNAEKMSGLTFSLYVGVSEEDSRGYAERLHNALGDPAHSVLVMCDPGFRALEIITGREARRILSDADCGLAAATMQVSFVAGDLVEGLATGIQQLGEAAHHPRTLHATVNPVDSSS
jgi:uncharacterized membrane protein YgcG